MLTISKLFGRSPFTPLKVHMDNVASCVEKLEDFFAVFKEGDQKKIKDVAKEISKLEHVADITKNDIRANMNKSLFLPVQKDSLLEILSVQDSIADVAEDISRMLTLRKLEVIDSLWGDFEKLFERNMDAFEGAKRIIEEFEALLQSSFGGAEADKVRSMVDDVARTEHEVDLMLHGLLRELFDMAEDLPYWVFHLWQHLFRGVSMLSNLSEKLGYRVSMILDQKK